MPRPRRSCTNYGKGGPLPVAPQTPQMEGPVQADGQSAHQGNRSPYLLRSRLANSAGLQTRIDTREPDAIPEPSSTQATSTEATPSAATSPDAEPHLGGPNVRNTSSKDKKRNKKKKKNQNPPSPPEPPADRAKAEIPVEPTPRDERARRRDFVRECDAADDNHDAPEDPFNMSGQQNKWREEQVLVICPGSHTTMAQLGCHELTQPAHRIRTRMFKDADSSEYRPYHTYKRKKAQAAAPTGSAKQDGEDEWEYVEDRDSVEGAIYPMQGGRIINMRAFLAFLDHVHGLITATYHNTPIVLVASPQWTRRDSEAITRYIFEKTRTPALCIVSSCVATQHGLKWPSMTIVDIGFEKVDITCMYEYEVASYGNLGDPSPERFISGGEVFTQELLSLLKDKGFTYDMAEQLKQSPICEVLPYVPDSPDLMDLPSESQPTSTQAAQGSSTTEVPKIMEPKPVTNTDMGTENNDIKENDEGILDVANIVASGNTREFLAKREKEKAEKVKSKKQGKGQDSEPTAAKPARLPNSKRMVNTFHYEALEHEDVQVPASNGASKLNPATSTNGEAPVTEGGQANNSSSTEPVKTATERRTKRVRKDIDVGLERFLFADRMQINRITDAMYRIIQSIDGVYKRAACWDNIVIVGNGSRIKGLKENIMQTLIARHLISPSTATIFTSELPSNMATPSGTGSQTPTGSYTGQLPMASSVNPLLQAATTASLGVPGAAHAPGSNAGEGASHHSHGQTPMSIKLAALPTYITDWSKTGFEEAVFLGALITGRQAYCIHHSDPGTADAQRLMSLTRVDYNELGPKGVRTHNMIV